jgi:hypothetical protein
VIRPSKSPYAIPAFLLPKPEGGYRMVVYYCKVNKICFDLPTLESAFQYFSGATVFYVLDIYSAYFKCILRHRAME